jgi:hypothetical protein
VGGESITNRSRQQFTDGPILTRPMMLRFWDAYRGGRDLDREPFEFPVAARALDRIGAWLRPVLAAADGNTGAA